MMDQDLRKAVQERCAVLGIEYDETCYDAIIDAAIDAVGDGTYDETLTEDEG
jgi:hypothetical protein